MNSECKAKIIWTPRKCAYPVENDGFCIFHWPKPTRDEKDKMESEELAEASRIEERFRQAFFALLDRTETDASITRHDFTQFSFPEIDFSKRRFSKEAIFKGSTFADQPTFTNVVFDEKVDFMAVKFKRGAFFHATKFLGSASFMEAVFGDESFPGRGWFVETEFRKRANFMQAHFYGSANFAKCHCFNEVQFHQVSFEDTANFVYSTFEHETSFAGSTFKEKAYFDGASFLESASFNNGTFETEALFGSWVDFDAEPNSFHLRAREIKCVLSKCEFRNVRLRKDAQIIFHKVDLKFASFLDTDLERVTFRDVEWYHPGSMIGGWLRPQALWDDFRSPRVDNIDDHDFEKIAENYRQLVLNYEKKRNYETAESFHVGEMEMRRKKKGTEQRSALWSKVRKWVNSYGLYRVSSNYGTSYVQATILLICFILLFSLAFLYSGFRTVNADNSQGQLIEYDLRSDGRHRSTTLRQWASDYGSAISLSLSIITFQKDRFYEPMEGWSRFWLYLAVFVLTAQAAMILLAVRRRFKR